MRPKPSFILDELYTIKAFNDKQESLISEFIENIEDHVEVANVERWFLSSSDEGEAGTAQIEHISDISEEEYDIREMFTEVLPVYQRQAMLLTLWGAFESQIEGLYCYATGKCKAPNNKRGEKSSKFGRIVTDLINLRFSTEPSQELKDAIATLDNEVRVIRNIWAHDGGIDSKNRFNSVDGISIKYSQISLSKEYIESVVKLMQVVARELNRHISDKRNFG